MKRTFQVILKMRNEQYAMHEYHSPTAIEKIFDTYEKDSRFTEFSVYEKNGEVYDLLAHDHKRIIGF